MVSQMIGITSSFVLLLTAVSFVTCHDEEQALSPSDSKTAEAQIYRQIRKLPREDLKRLHMIYLTKLHNIYANQTWEQVVARQLRTPKTFLNLCRGLSIGKRSFELLYDRRIMRPCQALKSIYKSYRYELEDIFSRFPQAYEATHLATLKYMSTTYCDVINEQSFRKKIYSILSMTS